MCFSAGVSFGASAVIGVISVVSFKKATDSSHAVLAGIPLFFAIQQAIEGFLWLSLQNPAFGYLYPPSTYAFLALALVVWPTMIPLMAMLPEPDARRKKILRLLMAAGLLVSLFHLFCLAYYGASASAQQHHIRYEFHFPNELLYISSVIYFVPALIPPFVSSHGSVRWIGVGLIVSYVFSWLFFHYQIISVWCFFATIISIIALYAIMQLNKQRSGPANETSPARLNN